MAVPTNTYTRFSVIGAREDLTDEIYNISPVETPVLTMLPRVKATNTLHEWQTDALESAAANRMIEGDDATILTATATVRLNNYCQISAKAISVSGTLQAANTAGRKEELAYQLTKRSKELKRDMEYAITRKQASSAGSASVPRSSAGMECWIATNRTSVGTGTAQTTPGFAAGTVGALTDSTVTGSVNESALKAVLNAAWAAGGNPRKLIVGAGTKQKLSGFSGIATQYRQNTGTSQATILAAADLYISDFGECAIIPDRFSRDETILGLDPDYWAVAYYRPMQTFEVAKTGDSEKREMLCEWTLEARNEKASFKVSDINSAL